MITSEEIARYDRQIRIRDFGAEGQEKLKRCRILIVGTGGLGSAIATYLAVAGVGSLRIVDGDEVSLSNLNRQFLYQFDDIGKKKAEAAKEKLNKLNSNIHVEALAETLTRDNAFQFVKGCDIILDATDNFPTRYLLNTAAVKKDIPLIYGGIYGLEGALTTIIPGETACLRCIFPKPPLLKTSPVLGVAAGTIGCLQTMEAIKYIVGIGELLTNRLLIIDGLSMGFEEVKLKRNAGCPDCS